MSTGGASKRSFTRRSSGSTTNVQALVRAACGGDEELRLEVESMLAHQASAEAFLTSPAWLMPRAREAIRDLAIASANIRTRQRR